MKANTMTCDECQGVHRDGVDHKWLHLTIGRHPMIPPQHGILDFCTAYCLSMWVAAYRASEAKQ